MSKLGEQKSSAVQESLIYRLVPLETRVILAAFFYFVSSKIDLQG